MTIREMRLEVMTRVPQNDAGRPPLLFVHGSSHAAWCWEEHFLDFFAAAGFTAVAVSLRGHGRSDGRSRLRWTQLADYVDDVRSIAASLPSAPVLVGHSLGGLVVQKYLERYDAGGAVLMASSPVGGMLRSGLRVALRHPLLFAQVYFTLDPGALYATPERARLLLFSSGASGVDVRRHAARLGSESFRALFDMTFDRPRVDRIRLRNRPILVLGAADDAIVSVRDVEETARAYGAASAIFPRTGHAMMLDGEWRQVAEYIRHWLDARYEAQPRDLGGD